MNKERIIKQQARESLRGNLLVLLSGVVLTTALIFGIYYLFFLILTCFGAADAETEQVVSGMEPVCFAALCGCAVISFALSPFINGFMKAAANAAVTKNCEITDYFYFFSGARYLKTVALNLILTLITSLISSPVRMFTTVWKYMGNELLPAAEVALSVVSVILTVIVAMLFAHYPLCAYALDDSRGLGYYAFALIGFSFKNFGKLLRLTLSFAGWILLCFFVVPALYVVPYMETAFLNSARWLLAFK